MSSSAHSCKRVGTFASFTYNCALLCPSSDNMHKLSKTDRKLPTSLSQFCSKQASFVKAALMQSSRRSCQSSPKFQTTLVKKRSLSVVQAWQVCTHKKRTGSQLAFAGQGAVPSKTTNVTRQLDHKTRPPNRSNACILST
jgi:hypothetical protein